MILIFIIAFTSLGFAQGNSGAIWTTRGDCGDETQDANHYKIGETVFINGNNFDPGNHEWTITGLPGNASCDPGAMVAQGIIDVDASGAFCFAAYVIANDDCGEYQVKVGNKGDNYRVDDNPAITIKKYTNNEDADVPPGPSIPVGGTVTWKYIITNTGNTELTDLSLTDDKIGNILLSKTTLAIGESMTVTVTGLAEAGQYDNMATVTGKDKNTTVQDHDLSHYYGTLPPKPSIKVKKYTNGDDADNPPGPSIQAGKKVLWKYVITNTGEVDLIDLSLLDDKAGSVPLPQTTLAKGDSLIVTLEGTATEGQYDNTATVTAEYGQQSVQDIDLSHYFGTPLPKPGLQIKKYTNNQDADATPGPEIQIGQTVTWKYVITNTGDVQLEQLELVDDKLGAIALPQTTLGAGDSLIVQQTGLAVAGQYENKATVTAVYDGKPLQAEDLSHYFGAVTPSPSLRIKKYTNGADADNPPGPELLEGETVVWRYVITNTGNVALTELELVDDKLGTISLPQSTLPVGDSLDVTMNGVATPGQYRNKATVAGKYGDQTVTAEDLSHYFGTISPRPGIQVKKYTNDVAAPVPPGPSVNEGEEVTWKYVITNTGNVALTNLKLADDKLGDILLPATELQVGDSITVSQNGMAIVGQYENTAKVTAFYNNEKITDEDISHYLGLLVSNPSILIKKYTNNTHATSPPGPSIMAGEKVTWKYVLKNTGNVVLSDLLLTDDKVGAITLSATSLAPGDSLIVTKTGIATTGQYDNTAFAKGKYDQQTVTDKDISHYFGTEKPKPSLTIRKYTNGQDANTPPGPIITVGEKVTWKYVITNTGDVALSQLALVDDKIGAIALPKTTLNVGESITVNVSGTAQAGQYDNLATATAKYINEDIRDRDLSHYYGQICHGNIFGHVWNDLNRNGEKDGGEPGLGNVLLRFSLQGAPNSVQVRTNAAGFYRFNSIEPGNYLLALDPGDIPPGYALISGELQRKVTITPCGQNRIDFGFVQLQPIRPVVLCVKDLGNGTIMTRLSYINPNPVDVEIPIGPNNYCTPTTYNYLLPTIFKANFNPFAALTENARQSISLAKTNSNYNTLALRTDDVPTTEYEYQTIVVIVFPSDEQLSWLTQNNSITVDKDHLVCFDEPEEESEPCCNFDSDRNVNLAPVIARFYPIVDAGSWLWKFGEGHTDLTREPQHAFWDTVFSTPDYSKVWSWDQTPMYSDNSAYDIAFNDCQLDTFIKVYRPNADSSYTFLHLVNSSPSDSLLNWQNAIDGDTYWRNGTALVESDATGKPWAIFEFSDHKLKTVTRLRMMNDTGMGHLERHVTEFRVYYSSTDTSAASFKLLLHAIKTNNKNTACVMHDDWQSWPVAPTEVKYLKLVIDAPQTISRQLGEFEAYERIVLADAHRSSIRACGNPAADGIDAATLTLTLADAAGRPLTGRTDHDVRLFAIQKYGKPHQDEADSTTWFGPLTETNEPGVYTVQMTCTEKGVKIIRASVNGVLIDRTAANGDELCEVAFGADNPASNLVFVTGSPTYPGQGWDNAIDGDADGWDGTVSTRGDSSGSGPAWKVFGGSPWAIFRFDCYEPFTFSKIAIQTDNGIHAAYAKRRQARKIELSISNSGVNASDFVLVTTIQRNTGEMVIHDLGRTVTAKYVKLVILEPHNTSGAWRQLVEFKVLDPGASLSKRSAAEQSETALPASFALEQNYPNPFNPSTTIRYQLAEAGWVTIKVYDLLGKQVAALVNERQTAGSHFVDWLAPGMPSGIYYYRLTTGSFSSIRRMILLK